MLRQTQVAFDRVLQPAKVHFGLYAGRVKHVHLHVFLRMLIMPAGNIPITFLHAWYKFLAYLHLKGIAVEPVRIDEWTDKRFTFFKDPDGLPLELYEL